MTSPGAPKPVGTLITRDGSRARPCRFKTSQVKSTLPPQLQLSSTGTNSCKFYYSMLSCCFCVDRDWTFFVFPRRLPASACPERTKSDIV